MKKLICTTFGAAGTCIAAALGGWDSAIVALLSFMAIDYFTGWILAVVFKKSKKTDSGGYSSAIGLKGLCKKGMILLLVVVANLLDQQIGGTYVRDGVCIAFMVNEAMSIFENAGLMGLPIPAAISNALDILKAKQEGAGNG